MMSNLISTSPLANIFNSLTFLAGVPFNVLVVYLPQRLQIASGKSALNAGIHLLPYTFGAAVGAILGNVFAKRKLPVAYILLIASVLQVLGLALLSTLPTTRNFPDKGYGFAVIAGVGMGMTFGILILATPFMVPTDDFGMYNRTTSCTNSLLSCNSNRVWIYSTVSIFRRRCRTWNCSKRFERADKQ